MYLDCLDSSYAIRFIVTASPAQGALLSTPSATRAFPGESLPCFGNRKKLISINPNLPMLCTLRDALEILVQTFAEICEHRFAVNTPDELFATTF